MQSFKDVTGESWDVVINIGTAIRLKSRLGLEIDKLVTAGAGEQSTLDRLASDGILLFQTIAVCCEEQWRSRGLTEEEFAERFNGETIEAATAALLDEFINFSRPAARRILTELRRISNQYRQAAEAKLEALVTGKEFEEQVLSILDGRSQNLPASSESTRNG